jgi:hypothetical protein
LSQQQEREEGAIPILTLIHDLSTRFWGPTKELREDKSSSDGILQSPFAGCDGPAIQQKLREMVEATGSAINTHWFLVLDNRAKEDVAVIVNVGEEGVRMVQVGGGVASRYLAAARIAHPSIDESIEIAEDGDGVLRD